MKNKGGARATVVLFIGILAACGGGGSSSSSSNGGGTSSLPPGTEFVYAGDTNGAIYGYSVDPNSGTLTPVSGVHFTVANVPAAADVRLVADPSGRALYATNAGTGAPNVVAFTIDASTGNLTAVAGGQTLPVLAGKISVDPAGKNAYVIPDWTANTSELFAFSIDPTTHALSEMANQPTALPGVPHDLTVDPSGAFVYVTFEATAGNEIGGFSRDSNTGQLTVLPGSPFANTGGDSPQGIRVTPNGSFAVIANQATNNISLLSLTTATGALADVAGSPFADGGSPASLAIHPNGNLVFVANVADGTLSAYTLSAAGALTATGPPVSLGDQSQPESVAIDPSGKFLYAHVVPHEIQGFALDPATGALTAVPNSPFSAGQAPRDVVVVKP